MAFIDLTNVAAVNNWLEQASGTDSALIQSVVTGYSKFILSLLDRSYMGGIMQYNERYNGNGAEEILLRNYPLLQVNSLTINNIAIPQSPDYIQPGWVIDTSGSGAGLALASGGSSYGSKLGYGGNWGGIGNALPLGQSPYRFWEGAQNVAVSYVAGYVATAGMEEQTVPSVSPYTVTATNAATFWQDLGATTTYGAAATGYTVGAAFTSTAGVFTFPASMAGQQVLLNYQYGAVPEDLAQTATVLCATEYRRRKWLDQTSQMQPGIGTVAFSHLPIPADCKIIIDRYRRVFQD